MRGDSHYSRDHQLGAAMGAWAASRDSPIQTELDGPLDGDELQHIWMLTISGDHLEAVVTLFRGARAEVTVVWFSAKEDGVYTGRGTGLTPGRLTEMLEGIAVMERGGAAPAWLRPVAES
ncbi:hypothetical protein FHR83_006611 [Actinoplanes campanulatus]|uniref:Immunity protein Imm1 n=1 Tax=Actinoplanes campanulatus TaxID=113559 RepID=A0A7W5FHY1_9ACTN|nr:hypothetical protein [Actinoplanes campanulatus]MBB3098905.1 hypothetical protein [Actinoplanes campanulatus]